MSRKRIIVDIKNLEQALRLEETVKTGFCDTITENLLAWIAVEEDLATSYQELSRTYSKQEVKETMLRLSEASANNVDKLHGLLKLVSEFGAARKERKSMIENLISSKTDQSK